MHEHACMHPVRFELTPPKRTELESVALDRSAMDAQIIIYIASTGNWTPDCVLKS